ncbi:MAG: hypothetical protein KGI08_03820, partial [Thaumarchaeota archaeon]|nr:hypothetical protein [Nitrososphaerota archaeon]
FTNGSSTAPPTSSTLFQPGDIHFDSTGNMWIADTEDNRVLEYTTSITVSSNPSSTSLSESLSISDQIITGISPRISSIVAAGSSGTTFFSGNSITIHFSQPTNQKFGGKQNSVTSTNFTSLFACSSALGSTCPANLGTDFTATWLDPSTLVITAGSGGGPVTVSSNLVFTPIASSGLANAAATALVSTNPSPILSGSFSSPPIPFITSFVANDPSNGATTFHAGDTLLIRFSAPTNEPGGTGTVSQTEVQNIFSFTPSLGSATYTGTWITPSLFNVTINTVDGSNPAVIGTTTVTVHGTGSDSLTSNTSPPSAASTFVSPPLSGSFGTFTVSIPVSGGGTAVTTLPSGIIAQTTIGSSTAQTVTYTKTTAPTTAPSGSAAGSTLQFLGTPVDISLQNGACSTGAECTFSFEFTCDDVTAANKNLPVSQQITFTNGIPKVSVFHDRQHDGTFADSGDQLSTQVTQLSSCLFLASASDDHTSKFAIGGVIAALAILGANNAPTAPTLSGAQFASDEYPLTIDGKGFKLDNYTDTIPTSTFHVGIPASLKLLIYENYGPDDVQGVSLFSNLHGEDLQIPDANTIIAYDGGTTTVTDPDGFVKSVNISTNPVNDKLQVDFEIIFANHMDTSNLIIRTWDKEDYKQDTQIVGAFRVIDSVSTQKANSTFPDLVATNTPDTVKDQTLSLSSSLLQDKMSVPVWVKNNAKWWSDGKINDKNFLVGVQYLVQDGIITVPQQEGTVSSSETIPVWVKNDARFWAEGAISDQEFVQAVQYLIDNEMMSTTGNTSHMGIDPIPFR